MCKKFKFLCLVIQTLFFSVADLHMNGSTVTSKADAVSDESLVTSPDTPQGPQSPIKCFTPPHQPSPPTVPPNPKNVSRLRRAPSLSRTRPSLSHSSGELILKTFYYMLHNLCCTQKVIVPV